ncbi:hypothetical protein Cgig2_018855 [Carnegiea gigantea]|uniref:Leucine-rich repeat-containing N-terminal plant-type domain-containing protein n=1 Tax=Carnegiea gigantea TaxID=171969 RepID=A0A9Q1GU18_9CARY|nr:hypothetical protein Cgig2_018855 [Carnegiea gigantea]
MVREALIDVKVMVNRGYHPNTVMFNTLIDVLQAGSEGRALQMLDIMAGKGCALNISHKRLYPNSFKYSTIIDGLCEAGRLVDAQNIFDGMQSTGEVADIVTHNTPLDSTLISGFCEAGKLDVQKLFCLLVEKKMCIQSKEAANDNNFVRYHPGCKTMKLCSLHWKRSILPSQPLQDGQINDGKSHIIRGAPQSRKGVDRVANTPQVAPNLGPLDTPEIGVSGLGSLTLLSALLFAMEARWDLSFCPCGRISLQIMAIVLLLMLYFVGNPSVFAIDLHPQDRVSLIMFKQQLLDPDLNLATWVGSNCSNWAGIGCENQTGRVISMGLGSMNLSGTICPSLCNLLFLQTLNLSHNNFTSSVIPPCLGNLVGLRSLDLSHNSLGGFVPDTLAKLKHLRELNLNGNGYLGGDLPMWVSNFSRNLKRLDLGSNSFRGEIPKGLFHLESLRHLDLSENGLSGTLDEFHQPLEYLTLASNRISGTLPCFEACEQSLSILNLANNSFVGRLPSCMSSLRALSQLNLSSNGFKYEIPPMLVFSDKLLALDLSSNEFSGPLPGIIAETTDKSGLLILDLSHNQFSGNIPLKITELKTLQALFLSHNSLTGEIPDNIGNLTYLQVIDLSHNSLSGSIPLSIVGCFQLLVLMLSNNNLSGEIQPELDALDSLKILDISSNKISGQIPQTLAGCKSLEVVDFSSNRLSGPLNDAMNKWLNLKFLSLAQNKFNGPLPTWLFTFPAIRTIDLAGNRFSGFIPNGNFNIGKNFNDAVIDVPAGDAHLVSIDGFEMQISVIVMDRNEVSFAYDLFSPVGIDLSDNQLNGEIPESIFSLHGLEYLNLSYNLLEGQIPVGLEKMWNLRALDLSHNSLSGPLLANISSLQELTTLNLSYNSLSGFVSRKQGYWRFPGAFVGNSALCIEISDGKCQPPTMPALPGSTFKDDMEEGPISVWVFCVTAAVTFYVTLIALFCSTRSRNYILRGKV